jgi:hypothetical protein
VKPTSVYSSIIHSKYKILIDQLALLNFDILNFMDSNGFYINLDELQKGWNNDNELEKKFVTEDLELINKIKELLKQTLSRENNIANLADSLVFELNEFNEFFKGISTVESKEKNENVQKL